MMKNKTLGFTLIELLVAAALVVTSATVVVAIIISTFRDATRINNQEDLRQAGDTALSQVVNTIQNADEFVNVKRVGDTQAEDDCTDPDNTSYNWITVKSNGQNQTIYCSDDLRLNGQSYFKQNNVNVLSCTLTCTQDSSSTSPLVSVSVDLASNNSNLAEQAASILSFSKTVRMRNP